ncbi:hypothetical protein BELL_1188g00020 [Botrytis elliptica]|uniref:Heterokaryon incompatibility domain-containing protein n=1 Tax=Botrytis elliptica TaxID=278938 RepID=A0A4Z1INH1_9HELO|nr:hypothetical protein EAE99_002099 [Botrytis elliptica]TGO60780.1 hypothetical protein BELL_1188g00020 [Botrytis elliptica]
MPIDQSSPIPRAVAELSSSISCGGDEHDTSLESLCESCRRIDWSNITDWTKLSWPKSSMVGPDGRNTKPVRTFEGNSRSQLLNSDCRVCHLVGSLVNPSSGSRAPNQSLESSDQPLNVCLEACEGFTETWGGSFESWDSRERDPCIKLAVRSPATGSNRIYSHEDQFRLIIAHKSRNNEIAGIRMTEPLRVNFDFLRNLLDGCLEHHEECQSTKVEVAKLRVVEVSTKRICQAPLNCEYIALSYVWGDNSTCESSPGEFPSVVQDAFAVTEALGYQYLWVDRYCIDQNPNSPHMQSMINQMDLVYSNARATIVAASGSSASDGLPGISVPRYQAYTVVGKTHLVEVPNAVADIMLSNWVRRGWTYQEWYFSKRRLIFTDSEVLFLCNKRKERETTLTRLVHDIDNLEHKFSFMKPPCQLEAQLLDFRGLESHIEGYCKRDLSHDCDSLNAFAGVLRHYESVVMRGNRPMFHLWGVPLKLLRHTEAEEEEVLFDLLWYHEAIAHRRDHLPSWSWSGWGGSVRFGYYGFQIQTFTVEMAANKPLDNLTDENERATSAERGVRIQIPLDDRNIDLDSFCQELQLNLHGEIYPKDLHITSFIMPLRFRKIRSHQSYSHLEEEVVGPLPPIFFPTFLVRPGIFLGVPVRFDREYDFELHKLGLVLPTAGQFYKDADTYNIMILHPVADGKYERAGLLTLEYYVDTGDIEACRMTTEPGYLLNENDHPISEQSRRYMSQKNEESNKFLFLQDAEWKTICLV